MVAVGRDGCVPLLRLLDCDAGRVSEVSHRVLLGLVRHNEISLPAHTQRLAALPNLLLCCPVCSATSERFACPGMLWSLPCCRLGGRQGSRARRQTVRVNGSCHCAAPHEELLLWQRQRLAVLPVHPIPPLILSSPPVLCVLWLASHMSSWFPFKLMCASVT